MENKSEEVKAIKDFPMEKAMMSDMVALDIMGAMIQSDLAKNLEHPMSQITAIGFAFAKEFLRQREEWLKPKEETKEEPIKPASTIIRHQQTLAYINKVILNVRERQNPAERVVVVGHHSPSFQSCNPMYSNDYLMNGAYHSDLSEFILDHPEIVLWTHGHTHHCFDYTIGDCRIICNPRGYETESYSEYTDWNPNMVVEV